MSTRALEQLVVGWNRSRLDLASDEVLAQVLDRGDVEAWRELYRLASTDASLGEDVDWSTSLPRDDGMA
jgi:hypothetical protein